MKMLNPSSLLQIPSCLIDKGLSLIRGGVPKQKRRNLEKNSQSEAEVEKMFFFLSFHEHSR